MGAQDEYLRNFYILLTEKGAVPLTDPSQIAIYDSLCKEAKRPIDLTEELKLSSSTLHFFIDKMVESGILNKTKPGSDKKVVYYSVASTKIASSAEPDGSSGKMFADQMESRGGLSSVAGMMDCYMSEIGMDIDPVKMMYVRDLAASIDFEKKGLEDTTMDVREVFSELTGFTFSVFSFNPFTLIISGDATVSRNSRMLSEFVARLMEKATGKTYVVSASEAYNGSENMLKVILEQKEREKELYINTSLHHKGEEQFFVLDVDGSAGIMTSDVQMQIVDAVYERPLCITDIVDKVDFPRSTITSNLLRMVEDGVLTVFYAESGSAYYGLACSILFRKSHEMSADRSEISNAIGAIKGKKEGFMEGLLLYSIAYFKSLGFDTDYLMVVLGAKYMRASGTDTPSNFDAYFGKMSDIAKTIGLSLNVVSIYPLTIGIASSDPSSGMTQAMTFIKGMAHQGLEMASSGIFVRNTEDEPLKESVSFKEIYPALSMKPVKGVRLENMATPVKKKRTSSVKTALLNRSLKEEGKPDRSVRYITSITLAVVALAVILMVATPQSDVDAETFDLTFGDLEVQVFDEEGLEILPTDIAIGTPISLSIATDGPVGFVSGGIAHQLIRGEDGMFPLTMDSDYNIERLYDVSFLKNLRCSFSIFCGDRTDEGLIPSATYESMSEGLFVAFNNTIQFVADLDCCIAYDDRSSIMSNIPWQSFTTKNLDFQKISVRELPKVKVISFDAPFMIGTQVVSGQLLVEADMESIEMTYAEDGNVIITANGEDVNLDGENRITVDIPEDKDEVVLSIEQTDLY